MDLRCKITICDSREQLSVALSAHVAHLAAEAADARGRFLVAISGGSLLDIMAPALGSHPLRDSVDWSRWHVFWADERWVPRSSPESNYGVAVRQLFNHVGIPEEQIHAADDSLSPSETAKAYESDLTAAIRPDSARHWRRWPHRFPFSEPSGFKRGPALGGSCLGRTQAAADSDYDDITGN